MRFEIWQSVEFADCAFGYKPGAPMRRVWEGEMDPDPALHVTQVLDRIWIQFQRVGEGHMPPEGYRGRSLSIGDVVYLLFEDLKEDWWTPTPYFSDDPGGWTKIDQIPEEARQKDTDGK